jgi:hypothetical protein
MIIIIIIKIDCAQIIIYSLEIRIIALSKILVNALNANKQSKYGAHDNSNASLNYYHSVNFFISLNVSRTCQ